MLRRLEVSPSLGIDARQMVSELASEFEIAVFAKGVPNSGIPTTRLSREDAQYMVDCGTAHWVNNRRKSIQMDAEAEHLKIRDLSCQMGPIVSVLAAEGSHYHREIAAAWA